MFVFRPLWKQKIPRYPLWYKGNPQLRIYLPLFWMKLIKSPYELPYDILTFEVHPQMTNNDIKQYLEKIYKVPVRRVKSTLKYPELREGLQNVIDRDKHIIRKNIIDQDDQIRLAFVHLDDCEFEFPDIFETESPEDKDLADAKKLFEEYAQKNEKQWSKQDLPSWFR